MDEPVPGALVTARPYRNDDDDWWRVRRLLVSSHAEAANAFGASCGFTEEYRAHTWRREWDDGPDG